MINVNILNNIIRGITDQIPLVHSYYTVSPYDVWNVKDVQFGSVSFVITRVNTRETTTTYDATIYYADRLLENNANRDSVHSDAATVIQTIVGALNQADDYLEVSYPVGITLFEQEFTEKTAGGYANLSISTKGMGECFEDDFTVPEIIATSAYFTKEQITELFPLRTQLATVAFSGSFNDLKDIPDLVNRQDYNNLVEATENVTGNLAKEVEKKFDGLYDAVKTVTGSIGSELDKKVDDAYFDDWKKKIETEITNRPTTQSFDTLRTDIIDQLDTVRNDLGNKVGSAYFENWKNGIETAIEDAPSGQEFNSVLNAIDNLGVQVDDLPSKQDYNQVINDVNGIKTDLETRPTKQDFDNLTEAVIYSTSSLAEELNQKVSTSYFDAWADNVENELQNRPTQQDYNQVVNDVQSIQTELVDRPSKQDYNQVVNDVNDIKTDLETRPTKQSFDNLYEAVETITGDLAVEIEKKLSSAYFEAWLEEADIKNKISKEQYDELYEAVKDTTGNLAAQIKTKLDTAAFDAFKTAIQQDINSKTNKQDFDNLTQAVIDSTTFLTAALDAKLDDTYFEGWRAGIEAELSERVTKQDFDNLAENIDYTREVLEEKLMLYESRIILYLQSDKFETALMDIVTPIIIEYATTALDYYTRAEMDALLSNLNLEGYYTKEEIDAKLENLDLTEYYTKTEIDDKFTAIDNILNNVLYEY